MGTPVNWGPAKPLGDDYTGAMSRLSGLLQMLHILPTPSPPQQTAPDTSWHDQMVERANQSFRDADTKRQQSAQKLGRIPAKE